MREYTMQDILDWFDTVITETEIPNKDIVALASSVMHIIDNLQLHLKALELLKEQLMEENEALTKKIVQYKKIINNVPRSIIR